jgi:hypothetical protein
MKTNKSFIRILAWPTRWAFCRPSPAATSGETPWRPRRLRLERVQGRNPVPARRLPVWRRTWQLPFPARRGSRWRGKRFFGAPHSWRIWRCRRSPVFPGANVIKLFTAVNLWIFGISWSVWTGNTKGGSITVYLLFDWFGLVCFANKNKYWQLCHTADSKPVKHEVNITMILPP